MIESSSSASFKQLPIIHVQRRRRNGRCLSQNDDEMKQPSTSLLREFALVVGVAVATVATAAAALGQQRTEDRQNANDDGVRMALGYFSGAAIVVITWFSARLVSAYEYHATPGFGFLANAFVLAMNLYQCWNGPPMQRFQDENDPRMKENMTRSRRRMEKMMESIPKEDVERCDEITVKLRDGKIAINVRLIFPLKDKNKATDQEKEGEPLLPSLAFYCHGGGFVAMSPKAVDAFARKIANGLHAVVAIPQYRLAPEHKFPTAHEDCFDAFEAVVKLFSGNRNHKHKHKQQRGRAAVEAGTSLAGICDLSKIALVGDSAGGNIATHLAFCLSRPLASTKPSSKDKKTAPPTLHLPPNANLRALLLFCPVVTPYSPTASHVRLNNGPLVGDGFITWMWNRFLRDPLVDSYNPTVSLLLDENVKFQSIPSTVVITAHFDPLCDEGEQLAKRLASMMAAAPSSQAQSSRQLKQQLHRPRRVYAARRLEGHCLYNKSTETWAFQVGKALLNDTDVPEEFPPE